MATPEAIGPYRVLRLLGQGGAGVVYEVADPMTGRSMALKLLLDADEDPLSLERFEREAQLLARIRHRSVVRVHKIGRLREGPYLLEELVQGELLRSASQRDPLEPRRAAAIVRELADALATVHAAGILHRDLKPSNVILQADGIPVVLDFGVARDTRAERMTRTGELIGSAAYMSPEQAKGKRSDELDARVDVYGLGAVLYELLSGRPPFSGNGLQLLRQVIKTDPAWPRSLRAEVPADLDGIVQVAMSKDPADRYASAEALRDDLDRFLAGTRAARAPERPSSKGPLLAGVAAALGLLLLVALALRGRAERAPAPSPSTAPRVTRRPSATPRPLAQPLWALSEGEELRFELGYDESDQKALFSLQSEVRARVSGASAERVQLELEVAWVRAGIGSPLTGIGDHFDSRAPQEHPLAPIQAAVGGRFACTLDPRSGELSVTGLEAVQARVPLSELGSIPTESKAFVRRAVSGMLSDAFVGRFMASLLHVRSGSLPWEREGPTSFQLRARQSPLVVPSLLDPSSRRPATISGRSAYRGGRYREGSLTQSDERPERGAGKATWTLRLR